MAEARFLDALLTLVTLTFTIGLTVGFTVGFVVGFSLPPFEGLPVLNVPALGYGRNCIFLTAYINIIFNIVGINRTIDM